MKNALSTLRTLSFLFALAITSMSASAQDKNDNTALLTGFESTQNWVSASKACLGHDAGLTIVGDLMDESSSELFVNEQATAMVIFTTLSAEERNELLNAPEVGPFASSRMVFQSAQPVEGGMQITYAVTSKVFMTLLVSAKGSDDRIAVILSGSREQIQSISPIAVSCLSAKGGNDMLMAKN